jgi:hypothetical protein
MEMRAQWVKTVMKRRMLKWRDSAFSTKAGLESLKKGGRKIGKDSMETDAEIIRRGNMIRKLEAEKAALQQSFDERIKKMEIEMQERMMAMMASAMEGKASSPGVDVESAKEGSTSPTKESDNSPTAEDTDAPAAVK